MGKIDFEQGKLNFVVYFLFSFNFFFIRKRHSPVLQVLDTFLKTKNLKTS